jgi:hypothetical protein
MIREIDYSSRVLNWNDIPLFETLAVEEPIIEAALFCYSNMMRYYDEAKISGN